MRICPKCDTYYSDVQLAFCFADGTPLADVSPHSEKWSEGSRTIEEKAKGLRKHKRKRIWRRIVVGAMTALLLTMAVANSFTVETTTARTIPPLSLSPSRSPTPSPLPSLSPLPSASPSPSSSPSLSVSPSPTVVHKISGRVMSAGQPIGGIKIMLEGSLPTSTTTDANGNYAFADLRAGGSYTITPQARTSFKPPSRFFDNLRRNEVADFLGSTPPPECSETEKERIGSSIIARFGELWRRNIERERSRIISEAVDVKNAFATLGPIEFQPTFTTCSAALVTARYSWQVKADLPQGLRVVNVPKVKRFPCTNVLGGWRCF